MKYKLNYKSKKFLIKQYVVLHKSARKIAKELWISHPTVLNYLHKYNIETRNQGLSGKKHPMFNKNHTKIAKRKMSKARMGEKNPMFGKRGKLCPSYIDGRTQLFKNIKDLIEYSEWRKEVFKRDNYTCQVCYKCEGILEVHHNLKSFSILLQEFLKEYNQFSPIEDKETLVRLAIKWKPFWEINNGRTLCKDCHKEITYKIGGKIRSYNVNPKLYANTGQ